MTDTPPQRSCVAVLFGSVFAGVGLLIMCVALYEYTQALETYFWQVTPARVQSISVSYPEKAPSGSDNSPFELVVDYEYEFDGETYSGDRFQRRPYNHGSYQKLADLRWHLVKSEISQAYVNANDPTESILQRESLASGLIFVLFPLPFLVIGLVVLFAGVGWWPQRLFQATADLGHGSKKQKGRDSDFARSSLGGLPMGSCITKALGASFMLVGLGFGFAFVFLPFSKASKAMMWIETPCTILWSRVEVHDGDDGDTYSADVFYEYEYEGETHRSNEYSFMGTTSSSNRSAARDIVREYSAGKKATCYVDPNLPWHAVINREASQIGWWCLFPCIFFAIGLLVLFVGRKAKFERS